MEVLILLRILVCSRSRILWSLALSPSSSLLLLGDRLLWHTLTTSITPPLAAYPFTIRTLTISTIPTLTIFATFLRT